jgi:CRP/FNR family cyclic AMP-dependent transcriptional regulator
MAAPTELLRSVPLFSELDDAHLDRLADEFSKRTFSTGDSIATEGEGGRTFFVIEDGQASVSIGDREVGSLGPGDSFGEIALIDRAPRSATITATTDMTSYMLPIWSFRPIVEGSTEMLWKLLEGLAARLRAAEQRES